MWVWRGGFGWESVGGRNKGARARVRRRTLLASRIDRDFFFAITMTSDFLGLAEDVFDDGDFFAFPPLPLFALA
jgi:hypothetical protein